MSGIKEAIQVNTQGALLGVQEGSFSFVTQFRGLPAWKRVIILILTIGIIPSYLGARFGTEYYLSQKYGQAALSGHAAFNLSQDPIVGEFQIIRNPNNTYSAVVQVSNPNLDLSASGMTYTATFQASGRQITSSGTFYLLPNEKKYLVFPRIDSGTSVVTSGALKIDNVNWQKRLNLPDVALRASEPLLYDEANPLQFIAEGSIINDSPYQVGTARIVFLLFDSNNKIIGVSQRDESRLLPFGRRAYKQLWSSIYSSQVSRVQVIPSTNILEPGNITTDNQPITPTNNSNSNNTFF